MSTNSKNPHDLTTPATRHDPQSNHAAGLNPRHESKPNISVQFDLSGLPWTGIVLYGITGKTPNAKKIKLYDSIWALAASFPAPRLWNNSIGALARGARSTTTLGGAGGIAISEVVIYGYQPLMAAMESLLEIKARLDDNGSLAAILRSKLQSTSADGRHAKPGKGENRCVALLPGYGRPIAARDERIAPLMVLAKELGYDQGPMLTLAFAIEQTLVDIGINMQMNVVGLMAGFSADQGMTPRQHYHYGVLCFSAGILHCAVDAETHPPGSFFPLVCLRINYVGAQPRLWHPASP